jgi:hypothetical protein
MTKIILAIIFSLSALFCIGQTNSSIDSVKTPLSFLKNFYTIYITDIAIGHDPLHSSDSLVKKYCTAGLLNKIAEHSDPEKLNWWDSDPFIKAQDSDTSFLKTLSIRMNKMKTNSYSVSYNWTDDFTKKTTRTTIYLIVEKKKEGFRIADVW